MFGKPPDLQHAMWGCYASKLACRSSVPKPRADAINRVAQLFASWVAALGGEAAQKSETLVCIRGVHPTTGSRKDVIVLLVMTRRAPSVQFFARCTIAASDGREGDAQVLPDALPCLVSLRIVESRLSTGFRTVDIRSSEELAQELSDSGMAWSMYPLEWRLPERRQLLDHLVVGIGEQFVGKKATAKRVKRPTADTDYLVLDDDPLASGRAAAAGSNAGVSPPARGAAAGVVAEDLGSLAWGEEVADDEVFGDLAADVADDLRVGWFGAEPHAEGMFDEAEGAAKDALAGDVSSEAEDSDVAEGEEGGAPGAAKDEEWSIDDAIMQCDVSAMGYVSCKVPPWNAKPIIGRITTWPEPTVLEWRSIGCMCYVHSNCKSPGKTVWNCDKKTLLRWLLSGTFEHNAPTARKKQLGVEHVAMFKKLWPGDAVREEGWTASSAGF